MAKRYIGHLADDELVRLAQQGDDTATNVLIERYRRFASLQCRGYFMLGGDSDDLEQEALIGLYKAVLDYRPERGGSFRTFLHLCVSRQVVTAIRSAGRRKHQPLNRSVAISGCYSAHTGSDATLEELLMDERTPGPADAVVSGEAVAEMEATLSELLSELELEVFRLHRAGKSSVEIGESLGTDNKAIDNALQRIRRKLERRLDARSSPKLR